MRLAPTHLGGAVMVGVSFKRPPISTELYLSPLPGPWRQFGISMSQVQLTLSVFIAAFAAPQLVYGPLSGGTAVPTAVAICATTRALVAAFHLVVRPARVHHPVG